MNKVKYTVLGVLAVLLIITVYYRPQPTNNSLNLELALASGGLTLDASVGDSAIGQAPAIDQMPSELQPATDVQLVNNLRSF